MARSASEMRVMQNTNGERERVAEPAVAELGFPTRGSPFQSAGHFRAERCIARCPHIRFPPTCAFDVPARTAVFSLHTSDGTECTSSVDYAAEVIASLLCEADR